MSTAAPLLLASLTLTSTGTSIVSVGQLVQQALEQNPALEALEAQITSLEHEARRAGSWRNPRVMVAYQNVPLASFALGEEAMSMLALRIEQTVPWFGKTDDRARVRRLEAEAQRWALAEQRNRLRGRVKQAFYRLAVVRQLRTLTTEHVAVTQRFLDTVRVKYEVGHAAQHDLLRLELLRDQLADEIHDFDQRDRQLTAALNAARHRDPSTPIGTPEALALTPPNIELRSLQKHALTQRPLLRQLDAATTTHRQAADVARDEALPDPTVFLGYGLRKALPNGMGGRDLITIGVSLPVPIFYGARHDAQAKAAEARARGTMLRRSSAEDVLASGLADALATWQRATEKVTTYREKLVPRAQRALDAAFAAYQVDRAGFNALYDGELQLLRLQKTIRSATADGLIAQAAIEMLVGSEMQP